MAKLTTLTQSGDPPDMFHTWGGGLMSEYAKAGLLRDITKDVKGQAPQRPGAGLRNCSARGQIPRSDRSRLRTRSSLLPGSSESR
ncbi:MAG: extracellular solute-binding protein [Spirochaetia bacterium]